MDTRITLAIREMGRRLADPLTVTDLATLVQLSPSRFAHLFRAETGVAPMQHLHQLRMHQARLLLARTSLPVRAVMAQVGYKDASHFARDFRRHHDLCPLAWRRELLDAPGGTARPR